MQKVQEENKKYSLSRSKGEIYISEILSCLGIDHWIEYTIKEIPKRRFDFYIPSLNLIIEYDGYQHFVFPNKYHKSKRAWKLYNRADRIKYKRALSLGYNIARIDSQSCIRECMEQCLFVETPTFLSDPSKYAKIGILAYNEEPCFSNNKCWDMTCRQLNMFDECCKIVESKNGKIHSGYMNIKSEMCLECSQGHKFTMTLHNMRRGKWCKECY